MAKLVTLESLENKNLLCLDNFGSKFKETDSANEGYREVANITLANNTWGWHRSCFLACNSSGSMGFYMLSARYYGSFSQWHDLKFVLYGDSFRTSDASRLRCFYNSSTRTFSFWAKNNDWNSTSIKEIFSKDSDNGKLNILLGAQQNHDSIPTSAGTEIECQVAATNVDVQNYVESRVVEATTSNINDLRGGVRKLANFFSLFPKLKRGVNYGN